MNPFWHYFEQINESLLQREASFRKAFQYLEERQGPLTIVETGCVRNSDPWAMSGEGHSTILFDKFASARADGTRVHSVDLSESAVKICRTLVGENVDVTCEDSVLFLSKLADKLANNNTFIDLLYLDSYDVDFTYWYPSAAHHMKELLAISRAVGPETLVIVDDSPVQANLVGNANGQFVPDRFNRPRIGGKGRLIAEYAEAVGAEVYFSHYQHAWKGFFKSHSDHN